VANYFTADLHLDHSNLCRKIRPEYPNVNEMNSHIIEVCNATAMAGDMLYILGDVSWRRHEYWAKQFRAAAVLIRGNHDPSRAKCRNNFNSAHDILFKRRIDGKTVTMCHYPLDSWPGDYMLFGHWHGANYRVLPNRWDVGWDVWHRPVTLAEIIAKAHR
jgi:calcineurin-like phosphoesterase family protein